MQDPRNHDQAATARMLLVLVVVILTISAVLALGAVISSGTIYGGGGLSQADNVLWLASSYL